MRAFDRAAKKLLPLVNAWMGDSDMINMETGNLIDRIDVSRDMVKQLLKAALDRDEIAAWIHGGPCGDVVIEPGHCCGGHLDAADRVIAGILGGAE